MNYIKYLFLLWCTVTVLSCTPDDDQELGSLLDVEDLKFSVTQDAGNTNRFFLASSTPGAVPFWFYDIGMSHKLADTIFIPFRGEYWIKYKAFAKGGSVADSIKVIVPQFDPIYFSDETWQLLTNGEFGKKWRLDLDASGKSTFFNGPVYFGGNDIGWHYECTKENGNCWTWEPSLQGNSWIATVGDYGTMTFNLDKGFNVIADHKINSFGKQQGTFTYNPSTKMMTFSNTVKVIQDDKSINEVGSWTNAKVLSLTETSLQLGFLHKNGDQLRILNYVSVE